jgi:hypothetical protein
MYTSGLRQYQERHFPTIQLLMHRASGVTALQTNMGFGEKSFLDVPSVARLKLRLASQGATAVMSRQGLDARS